MAYCAATLFIWLLWRQVETHAAAKFQEKVCQVPGNSVRHSLTVTVREKREEGGERRREREEWRERGRERERRREKG